MFTEHNDGARRAKVLSQKEKRSKRTADLTKRESDPSWVRNTTLIIYMAKSSPQQEDNGRV